LRHELEEGASFYSPRCREGVFPETQLPVYRVRGKWRVIRFSDIYVLCRGPLSGLQPYSTKRLRKTSTKRLMPPPCVPRIVPTTPYTGLALLSSLSHPSYTEPARPFSLCQCPGADGRPRGGIRRGYEACNSRKLRTSDTTPSRKLGFRQDDFPETQLPFLRASRKPGSHRYMRKGPELPTPNYPRGLSLRRAAGTRGRGSVFGAVFIRVLPD
jgi:hypothetical protein